MGKGLCGVVVDSAKSQHAEFLPPPDHCLQSFNREAGVIAVGQIEADDVRARGGDALQTVVGETLAVAQTEGLQAAGKGERADAFLGEVGQLLEGD